VAGLLFGFQKVTTQKKSEASDPANGAGIFALSIKMPFPLRWHKPTFPNQLSGPALGTEYVLFPGFPPGVIEKFDPFGVGKGKKNPRPQILPTRPE